MPRYNVNVLLTVDADTPEDAETIAAKIITAAAYSILTGEPIWTIDDVQEIDPEDVPNA